MILILTAVVVTVLTVVYLKIAKVYTYWTDRGVKQRKQTFILGDNAGFILKRESQLETLLDIYNAFPEESKKSLGEPPITKDYRYVGIYEMVRPSLLVRDPELVKRITVKDFDHFVDHPPFVPEDVDPLLDRNLLSLKGDRWHDMRSTLSPTFTTNKMKVLFSLISDCATAFVEYLAEANQETVSLELKDAFTRFCNDVIATTSFGIKCNSMKDKENEFYMLGEQLTSFTGFWRNCRFLALAIVPNICKMFGIRFFDKDAADFFQRIVVEAIKAREANNIIRPDMLHLLMEARKRQSKDEKRHPVTEAGFAAVEETQIHSGRKPVKLEITDLDITAQCVIFFFGGFDTVSTALCFTAYELALNPEIQKKLQTEVDATVDECKGELTYEALMKMRYMDMVISESLRKWPGNPTLDRVCTKAYTIEPVNVGEKPVHLNVGDAVWIPTIGFHRDEKYFAKPEVFDPERFSDENKGTIQANTYFPFGLGPRNCIASRFALMEIKALFFHLLSKFDFVVTEKTQIPLKLKPIVGVDAHDGFWIGLRRRTNVI